MTTDTWIMNRAFIPEIGNTYEVTFGEVTHQGKTGPWSAKIRVDGAGTKDWIDLATGQPLDPELSKYVVKGFRKIS